VAAGLSDERQCRYSLFFILPGCLVADFLVAYPVGHAHIQSMSKSKQSSLALARDIWLAAVQSVKGDTCTRLALSQSGDQSWKYILAVGKAASSMMLGALDALDPQGSALVVTKYDHTDPALQNDPRITVVESGHPMPDKNSLAAGKAVKEFVLGLSEDAELLVLVSGGASALAEYLVPGMDLEKLQCLSLDLLADGYSIDQINSVRIEISQIKGGKLLRGFKGKRIQVYGLSDIPGDDATLIGSGIAAIAPPVVKPFPLPDNIAKYLPKNPKADSGLNSSPSFAYQSTLVGSNQIARQTAADFARKAGLTVVESTEIIDGDIEQLATKLALRISNGENGVYIWGGESTVRLPDQPGQGGRNQSLTLTLALKTAAMSGISAVVAGTDGTDGPTSAAGGEFVSGMNLDGAADAVRRADAGSWLENAGALFSTGPTGTNVMDLIILIKR